MSFFLEMKITPTDDEGNPVGDPIVVESWEPRKITPAGEADASPPELPKAAEE